MTKSNQTKMLHERLLTYFDTEKFYITPEVANMTYNLICQNINCDMDKLVMALDSLIQDNRTGFQNNENIIDISRGNKNFYIKGFSSNGYPMLYFFTEDAKKPILKIKSARKSGLRDMSLKVEAVEDAYAGLFQKSEFDGNDPYFIRSFEMRFDQNGCEVKDGIHARTKTDGEEKIPVDNICDEYKNFYKFLKQAMAKNGHDNLKDLTPTKFDILYAVLYQKLKNVTDSGNELNLSDIVMLLDMVLNNSNNQIVTHENSDTTIQVNEFSGAVDTILNDFNNIQEHTTMHYTFIKDKKSEPLDVRAVKNDGYMSLDMKGMNSKQKLSYMFAQTDKGFTLFRGLSQPRIEKDVHMITLNLSNNLLKLSIKRDSKNAVLEDVILEILDDGEFVLDSISTYDIHADKAKEIETEYENQKQA